MAYAMFFAAVLLTGLSALAIAVAREWRAILLALRGEFGSEIVQPLSPQHIRILRRDMPYLKPVKIGICRL